MKKIIIGLIGLLCSTGISHADCGTSLPYGTPHIPGTTAICHQGYFTAYDSSLKIPRFVAWNLTADHARGCNGRSGKFARDPMAAGKDVPPSAYSESGYDKGHLADANDFNYDPSLETQSFYMTNMTPQVPGLNRGPWKWVEQASRDWAVDENSVEIYAGTIVANDDSKLSQYQVDVPRFFWKIIIDSSGKDSIAFIMPNAKFSSKLVPSTITSIHDIEEKTGFSIPVPDSVDKFSVSNLNDWYVDDKSFHEDKATYCNLR